MSNLMVTGTERQELNALSLEVFKSSSRWKRMVENGVPTLRTREVFESVPSTEEGKSDETKSTFVPVKNEHGIHVSFMKRYTLSEIKQYMLDLKRTQEEIRAMIEKLNAEKQAKAELEKTTEQVRDQLSGSSA